MIIGGVCLHSVVNLYMVTGWRQADRVAISYIHREHVLVQSTNEMRLIIVMMKSKIEMFHT